MCCRRKNQGGAENEPITIEIRNKLALDMAPYSGSFSYTSYGESVDLYMNGDYKGTYLLVKKTEVQKNRLQITDLEKAVPLLPRSLNT